MKNKFARYIFFVLIALVSITPLWTFKELFYPYITSKAFYFRILIQLAAPFYLYLLITEPGLRPKIKNPLNLSILAFLAVNYLSAIFGENITRSLWGNYERMGGVWYFTHLTALYFYFLAVGQAGLKYLKFFFHAFLLILAVLVLNGVFGKLGGPVLTPDPSLPERVSSSFGNPIFFASYLIIPFFLSVYFAYKEKSSLLKWLYILSSFLCILGIFLSATRGALVGLVVAGIIFGFIYVFFSGYSKTRKLGYLVLVTAAVFIITIFLIRVKLPEESSIRRLTSLSDTNSKARLIQWKMAYLGFLKYPVFGVGAENYYVIFNEFYNPEMYKYDASWFDKPHNYWLEILTTSGILGFVFYLAILIFFTAALYRGLKSKILNPFEFSILLAGMVAYQVQNFFVFDTVSASMVWYIYLAVGALYGTVPRQTDQNKEQIVKKNEYAPYVFVCIFAVVLYVEYITNIIPIKSSRALNFGQVYSQANPQQAADYFDQALKMKDNLDPGDTANFFARFAASLPGSDLGQNNPAFVKEVLQSAIKITKEQAERTKNDPILWSSLSTLELNNAIYNNQQPLAAKQAIDKALALAPKRVEILQIKLQYYGFLKDWKNVVLVAEEINNLNPNKPDIKWQLAMAYYLEGSLSKAVAAADEALELGFKFKQLQQFAWYIDYQQKQTNWEKVAALLEQAIELEPGDIGLYTELAKTYAKLGNKEKAQMLADQIMIIDPSQKAAMQAFVNSLK